MSTSNETPSLPADDAAPRPAGRRLGRVVITAGIAAIALATVYVSLVAGAWWVRANDLRATTADLDARLTAAEGTFNEQRAELVGVRHGLDDSLDQISQLADDKAKAQDNQDLYAYAAQAMAECARERQEVLYYVKTRYSERWIIWQVHRYDDSVADYCGDVAKGVADLMAEEEGDEA